MVITPAAHMPTNHNQRCQVGLVMVATIFFHFAAEYPVRVAGIGEDNRQQNDRAN